MIAIIDSGIANLRSVQKGFERAGHEVKIVEDPRLLREARIHRSRPQSGQSLAGFRRGEVRTAVVSPAPGV